MVMSSNGCGGGGSEAPAPTPEPGGTPAPSGSGPGGYIWYERSGDLFKVQGATGEPQRVNWLKPDGVGGTRAFRVSANSSRYLQKSNYGSGSGSACMIFYFDAATHTQQGFVDMNGYVGDVRVSPSGNYIAMVRSPEYINTLNLATSENIAGLTVVDISDTSNPRAIRSAFDRDAAAVIQFAWHGNDQYVYMTLDGILYGGTAAGGQPGERRLGRFASDTLIKGEFSLHPSGTSFLIKGVKASDNYDIYLCGIDGAIQRQMTAVGRGYEPLWSPDGSWFMFKVGSDIGCSDPGCGSTCSAYYAPATVSNLVEANAFKFDGLKVPCLVDHYWSVA
jgi:WD40-like Beta Propeller Repeat